ncbi:hypothetical protein HDU96_008646 [Phlyctochytrium bullatum]|nr:hypothetical protein HDU96_008646 [Phlyctochytrium bullatum]
MSTAAYRTFLGYRAPGGLPFSYGPIFLVRVWPATFLKLYFPFMISGSTIYFLFGAAHIGLMNDANDKWVNIVKNVKEASKKQVFKNEAANWYEAELAKKEAKDAGKK